MIVRNKLVVFRIALKTLITAKLLPNEKLKSC
jgi:hypothetical protein